MIYPLGGMSRVGFFLPLRAMAAKAHVEIARVYQNYHSIVAVETRLIASLQLGRV